MLGLIVRDRSAVAAIEVALALLLLALALVPLISAVDGTRREATLTGRHVLAHLRVQAMLDAVEASDIPWPAAGGALEEWKIPEMAGPPPEALTGGTTDFAERIEMEALEEGLIQLRARVSWRAPLAVGSPIKAHEAVSIRILARPDRSWLQKLDGSVRARPTGP